MVFIGRTLEVWNYGLLCIVVLMILKFKYLADGLKMNSGSDLFIKHSRTIQIAPWTITNRFIWHWKVIIWQCPGWCHKQNSRGVPWSGKDFIFQCQLLTSFPSMKHRSHRVQVASGRSLVRLVLTFLFLGSWPTGAYHSSLHVLGSKLPLVPCGRGWSCTHCKGEMTIYNTRSLDPGGRDPFWESASWVDTNTERSVLRIGFRIWSCYYYPFG